MKHLIDMTGQRYGMMTVIEKMPRRSYEKNARWRCRCDCGKERVVEGQSLRRGYCRSCGCVSNKAVDRSEVVELKYIKNDPDWKEKKKAQKNTDCPYNDGLICEKKNCWRCGWNPKVAEVRRTRLEAGRGN